MRITFVIPEPALSGGFRVIACFAEELQCRGHEVALVATSERWHLPLRSRVKSLLLGRGWPGAGPAGRHASHFDGRPLTIRQLPDNRPLREDQVPDADVVVATWWATAGQVARLGPSKGAKVYFIQQYEANFDQPADQVDETWRLPMQKIVCSRWLADLARDRFGDDEAVVSPNGIDLEQFDAPPRGKQGRPTVGLLYSNQPPKAWATALGALIAARREIPDLRVVATGFLEPTSALPLPPDCEFFYRVPQDQLASIYARCDAWLCASSSEGFHLPPHEAMACRCPVVSTRVGGPMDLIDDGVNGFLVEPFDACGLARRLVEVLRMPEDDWRRMSDAAFERARLESWGEATDRFELGLRKAVGRPGRPLHAGRPAGALA